MVFIAKYVGIGLGGRRAYEMGDDEESSRGMLFG